MQQPSSGPSTSGVVRNISSHIAVKLVAEVVVLLIVAGISALVGMLWRDHKYEQQFDAAPRIYVDQLGKLIDKAYSDGPNDARVNARAIVDARNSLATSLESVAMSLDGEINHLADLTGKPTIADELLGDHRAKYPKGEVPVTKEESNQEIYDTIRVLHQVWPSKREQIEVQIRKLITELGLYPVAVGRHSE